MPRRSAERRQVLDWDWDLRWQAPLMRALQGAQQMRLGWGRLRQAPHFQSALACLMQACPGAATHCPGFVKEAAQRVRESMKVRPGLAKALRNAWRALPWEEPTPRVARCGARRCKYECCAC